MDNLGAMAVLRKGSMKPFLNELAASISEWCASENITLSVSCIRRPQNEDANRLSRFEDLDDWGVSFALLRLLQEKWFDCSIDHLASTYNHKLPRFNSCYSSSDCETVDSFSQEWSQENNWLVPPPSLIPGFSTIYSQTEPKAFWFAPTENWHLSGPSSSSALAQQGWSRTSWCYRRELTF